MRDPAALLRAGRIDALKHLRIDGSFIVRQQEFEVARRGACFRFREPVNQFVNLLLGLHCPNYLSILSPMSEPRPPGTLRRCSSMFIRGQDL